MDSTQTENGKRLDEALALLRQLPQLILDSSLVGFDLDSVEAFDGDLFMQIRLKQSMIETAVAISPEDLLVLVHQWLMLIREGRKVQRDREANRIFDKNFPHSWYERRDLK